jgi:hypothetical protein
LDFGVYSPRATPHLGFGLRFDASRAGIVNVVDGELEMVPGIRVALSGTAHVDPGFRSGTFSVYGRGAGGRHTGGTFTGGWTCG